MCVCFCVRTILSKSSSEQTPTREHFVFTDTTGVLYHFLIEGNMVKDGSKIPPDVSVALHVCGDEFERNIDSLLIGHSGEHEYDHLHRVESRDSRSG